MAIETTARHPAIALKPGERKSGHNNSCKFGGDPNLPKSIAWPEDSAGRPMHHLVQIDCAALPKIDADFPQEGTLFLFITGSYAERRAPDLSENEPGASQIIYIRDRVTEEPQRSHPDDTPPLGDKSLALQPVVVPVEPKPKGIISFLFNTQPKRYSKSTTRAFEEVPLQPVLFDSEPNADPSQIFSALGKTVTDEAIAHGIRPNQMLGYVPAIDDLHQLDAEGYAAASTEKASEAYTRAARRVSQNPDDESVLLFQFSTSKALNLDVISREFVLRFYIKRRDLRARAFDRHWVQFEKIYNDGSWRHPKPIPELFQPEAKDVVPAVILKPLVHGERPVSQANYFCGWPQLPEGMAWPINDVGTPLHFLLQLDCATVSQETTSRDRKLHLPPFPKQGTIFVFVNALMDEIDTGEVQILYSPEDVSHLVQRCPPEDLTALRASGHFHTSIGDISGKVPVPLQDMTHETMAKPWEPRLPFDPLTYATFKAQDYSNEVQAAQEQVLRQALPHEPYAISPYSDFVIDWLPNWRQRYLTMRREDKRIGTRSGVIRNVPDTYPWRWADVREAIEAYFSMYRFEYPDEREDQNEVNTRHFLWPEDLAGQARAWYTRALQHDFLDRIEPEVAAEYRAWLEQLDRAYAKVPVETNDETYEEHSWRLDLEYEFYDELKPLAVLSLGQTRHWLTNDVDADDLPDSIRKADGDLLRHARSYSELPDYNVHHAPSPHQLFPAPCFDRYERSDVLLFEISTGYGLRTQWADCCWLQIWIDPDDLAEHRFDRIKAEIRW